MTSCSEQSPEELQHENEPPFDCPFDGCDWSSKRPNGLGFDRPANEEYRIHERRAEEHYEDEHAGRAKVRVTLEMEQRLGAQDPHDIADRYHDQFEERDDITGWDVAYAVAEVIEESDPHPESGSDE